MSTLASQSVSLHATPVGGRERPQGSYVSAETLTNEANFSGETQQWHVIGSAGVTVRQVRDTRTTRERGEGGEGEGDRERETETHRETDRQADR